MNSIKLPNFFYSHSLNKLKKKMGIDKYTYGNFGDSNANSIRIQLENFGIELEDLSELTPLEDYTLAYKGQRIILYIRNVKEVDDIDKLPKFHVAYCSTLQSMIRHGRKNRYVISQKGSNVFDLNFVNGNAIRRVEHPLNVCKNCLDTIHWQGYVKTWTDAQKNQCVRNFDVNKFFESYPKDLRVKWRR